VPALAALACAATPAAGDGGASSTDAPPVVEAPVGTPVGSPEAAPATAPTTASPPGSASPKYWRVHIEELLPEAAPEYERAMQAIVQAQRAAGVPMEVSCWYALAVDDGRYVNISPVPDEAALDRGPARAEIAARTGEDYAALQDAMHATLLAHHTNVLRFVPDLSVHVDDPPATAPGYVQFILEWPRLDRLEEYLDRARRIRDVLQVMDYPLAVRVFRGAFGDWDHVYVYEGADRSALRGARPLRSVLNEALGEEAAAELLRRQEECVRIRKVFYARPRADLSALPAGSPAWLWP
jgi:hypothetical protein